MSKNVAYALRDLSYAFPQRDVPDQTIAVYDRALDQFPEPAVLVAIEQAKMRCKFFPTIAEITEIIGNLAHDQDATAEAAWTEVQREARRVGYQPNRVFQGGQWYDPPKPVFSSPLITEAVESMGWKTICQGDNTTGEIGEQFKWTYRNLRKRDVAKVQRADFSGLTGPALADGMGAAALKGEVA